VRAAVAGPGRQHQPLVGHLKELGSYLGVAKEALLKLKEGKVQGAKELWVGEVGEGLVEVSDGHFRLKRLTLVVWFRRHFSKTSVSLRESNTRRSF